MFHQLTESLLDVIEVAPLGIEVLAVTVIVVAGVWGLLEYLRHTLRTPEILQLRFAQYKLTLGRALLLGLEILVAADIIKTVALDTTIQSVAVLGMLITLYGSLLVVICRYGGTLALSSAAQRSRRP